EGISCTTRQIFNANSFSKRGTGTIDLVDDECELRGKACKSAEGHQIDHGHHPGVDVAEDCKLLTEISFDRDVFKVGPCQQRTDDCPRCHENSWIVNEYIRSIWKALWGDETNAQERKAHQPRCD